MKISSASVKIKPRTVDPNNRENLGEVLPLMTPYVVMVDPSSACNLRCLFCPTGDIPRIKETGRYQGLMSIETYEKIIQQIDGFSAPIRVLRLYKEGEPLLNKEFPRFVRLAKQTAKILRVDTTTNGLPLTPSLNQDLVDSKIDQINISVNGMTEETFYRLTKRRVNIKTYIANIIDLCKRSEESEIYIKAIHENLPPAEREMFFDVFSSHADRIFLEHLQPNWPDFEFDYDHEDYTVGHYGQPLEQRSVCPYIFYMMVINADGSVSACVQDWQHELVVGDVREESLTEIWSGAILEQLQTDHLNLRKDNYRSCQVCPVLRHGTLDNIDDSRKKILLKLA